eukprot:scaffold58797_cov36-Tisochrysis_lutea.AAC.3
MSCNPTKYLEAPKREACVGVLLGPADGLPLGGPAGAQRAAAAHWGAQSGFCHHELDQGGRSIRRHVR